MERGGIYYNQLGLTPEIPVLKEDEFPKDPQERYAVILSSIGNHAGKQITFLSIPNVPGTVISPYQLHRDFLENSGYVWHTKTRDLQKIHARSSLIPIGMVAEEVGFKSGIQETTVGFTQTEAGRKYGDPVARFLLKYAAEHDMCLEQILGSTSSKTDSRAPYNRARILEYLAERTNGTKIKNADITRDLGFSGETLVSHALGKLQEQGLVLSESVNVERTEGQFTYSLNPEFTGEGKDIKSRHPLALLLVLEAIEEIASQGGSGSEIGTVVDKIRETYPDYSNFNVIQVFTELNKGGYFIRNKFEGSRVLSKTTILSEGEQLVKGFLLPLRKALTDTPEGETLRREWMQISWQTYAPRALQIHIENSRKANRTNPTALTDKIRDIIFTNPGLRTSEVKKELKKAGLPHETGKIFQPLLDNGTVRKVKEGRSVMWFPVENDGSANNTQPGI